MSGGFSNRIEIAEGRTGDDEVPVPSHAPLMILFCFGIWLHAAHSMLVATTIPLAVQEIGGAELVAWVFTLYQIGSILAGVSTGRLALRFGIRSVFLIAGTAYGFGCLLCATAPEMRLFLGGRLLQGCGGGALVALAYMAVERIFPPSQMPRLIAVFSVIWSAAAFCGPLIGGGFAAAGHWRLAFWAFAAQALLLVLAGLFVLPAAAARSGPASSLKLPALRLLLLALAIATIGLMGMHPHDSTAVWLLLLAAFLFWAFLRLDARATTSRLLPSRPLDPHTAIGAGICAILATSLATMSFLVYGPLLLTELHDVSPLTAGYFVASESLAWGAAAFIVSKESPAWEASLIRLGSTMILLGLAGFAFAMPFGSLGVILLCALLQGAGYGTMWSFIVRRLVDAAPTAERPLTAAMLPTLQQIGFAIGAALCGIVANLAGFGDRMTHEDTVAVAVWIFIAFVPAALLATFMLWRFVRQAEN